MFSTIAVLSCAALLSLAAPLPVADSNNAVQQRDQPADWWTEGLEPYATYHARYMALDCLDEHGSDFFNACCHPLLKSESLDDREPMCNPANTCDDDNNNNDTPAPKAPAAPKESEAPKASPAPTAPKNVAPAPPKNVEPAPTPKASPPAPKPAPAPAPPAPAPPANNNAFHTGGHGTWFTQNGVAGACGTVHQDSDKVVALDSRTYDNGAHCGKTIEITDTDTGKTFNGIVADECPTCDNPNSVDFSTSLFQEYAPLSVGELNIKWRFA